MFSPRPALPARAAALALFAAVLGALWGGPSAAAPTVPLRIDARAADQPAAADDAQAPTCCQAP